MSGAEEGIYFSNVRGDRDSTAVFRPRWTRAQTGDQVARRAEMKPRRKWCVAQGEVRVRAISGEMIRDLTPHSACIAPPNTIPHCRILTAGSSWDCSCHHTGRQHTHRYPDVLDPYIPTTKYLPCSHTGPVNAEPMPLISPRIASAASLSDCRE